MEQPEDGWLDSVEAIVLLGGTVGQQKSHAQLQVFVWTPWYSTRSDVLYKCSHCTAVQYSINVKYKRQSTVQYSSCHKESSILYPVARNCDSVLQSLELSHTCVQYSRYG